MTERLIPEVGRDHRRVFLGHNERGLSAHTVDTDAIVAPPEGAVATDLGRNLSLVKFLFLPFQILRCLRFDHAIEDERERGI